MAPKEEEKKKVNVALLSCHKETLNVKAYIKNVLEWYHEHDPDVICDDRSRVSVAQEWLEVINAVS